MEAKTIIQQFGGEDLIFLSNHTPLRQICAQGVC